MSSSPWPAGPQPAASPRALLRVAAGLAHTVNNALTGTIGYLELALRQLPADGEAAADLQIALACAHRAAESVRQVVAFATAPADVAPQPVELTEIARSVAARFQRVVPPGVTVAFSGDPSIRVPGHPALLEAAVEQIVQNAVDAMPERGRLTIETEEVGGRCRLWVRDTGPGLPAEVQPRLFEPFVTTKSFGHLGLGLALAAELVRAQDGTLTVSSSPGLGTTVLFSFPTLRTADRDAAAPWRARELTYSDTRGWAETPLTDGRSRAS